MLDLFKSKAYRRAIKKYTKSPNFDIEVLESVIRSIQKREILDQKFRDHELRGKFRGLRECHIESDLLLLYQIDEENGNLYLLNLDSHSNLFG